ncbi:hypothetical protein [Chelativorans sp. YIM 93263]|uniref:hypothetical protein n=1 Tax=Chelativorans sp. YIM 93263 TaxID=2906648 RepID=UPI002379185F|nr:hypothetical protein [Chelativorans sp. YIM 93263]
MDAHSHASAAAALEPAPTRFSRPRFALLLIFGVYPLITAILYLVFPLTEGWLLWQRTLLIVPIMVVSMIWGLIPLLQRAFRGFLNPPVRQIGV